MFSVWIIMKSQQHSFLFIFKVLILSLTPDCSARHWKPPTRDDYLWSVMRTVVAHPRQKFPQSISLCTHLSTHSKAIDILYSYAVFDWDVRKNIRDNSPWHLGNFFFKYFMNDRFHPVHIYPCWSVRYFIFFLLKTLPLVKVWTDAVSSLENHNVLCAIFEKNEFYTSLLSLQSALS